jgi:large subunit ribosomal protein L31
MKRDIHPEYRPVVFEDVSIGQRWLGASTVRTDRTIEWEDGRTYPLFTVEISNLTHPYFTGQMKIVDTAGRVERFNKRYGTRKAPKA